MPAYRADTRAIHAVRQAHYECVVFVHRRRVHGNDLAHAAPHVACVATATLTTEAHLQFRSREVTSPAQVVGFAY